MFEVVLSGAAKVKFFQNGKVRSEHITMLQNGCSLEEMGVTSGSWTLDVSITSDIAESTRSTVKH